MSYREEDKEYLLKIIKAVNIIETHIITNPKIKEFILSIANDDIITKLDTIQNAESQNYIARNKSEEITIFNRLSSLVNAIIYITYLLYLLTDFYEYTEYAKGKDDIIFNNVNVSQIKDIVPTLLTNKQAIIAELYYAYNSKSKKEDIEFYSKFFNRNKVNHEYTSRSNPMAAGPKTTKYRRHKRGYKRSYKRSYKRGAKRSSKRGAKRRQ
jgi:hypothetical protein